MEAKAELENDHPAAFFDGPPRAMSGDYRLHTDIAYRAEEEGATDYMKTRCRLDVYTPAARKGFATVIWFHGGGISNGQKSVPIPLLNRGVGVVSANYRLSPLVESPEYLEDAAATVAWVFHHIEEYGGDPARIFVSGHSAGGYLASMVGLDKSYLAEFGIDADSIAGLVPFSGHSITHFTVRKEQGIPGTQPTVDRFAPLFHVRKDAPPMLLITGDREREIMGRYEETAYFWRMMRVVGHPDCSLRELGGFDHGGMPEPAFPLMLDFMETRKAGSPE
ncbi:MAG: alpha/beta hydrolase [Verrucomicrobiae bacterium]|nr:alpha/beta hydrolase [Verrucomicrobiae bacterium]